MPPRDPLTILDTHEVANQPPLLADYNIYDRDPVLRAAVAREGAGWAEERPSCAPSTPPAGASTRLKSTPPITS